MNFTNFLNSIRTLLLALVLSIGISYAYAAWAPPTSAPTGGNTDAPVNVGNGTQVKAGALTVNGLLTAVSDVVVGGNVGIGTASPGAKLDVNGGVKVATVSSSCAPSLAGTIMYDSDGKFKGCNGLAWVELNGSGRTPPSGTQTFISDDAFTIPSGVSTITVEVWGAGGGGGSNGGSGGGGGGYAKSVLSVSSGSTHIVTVGVAGNGGYCGFTFVDGSTGGTSSFGSFLSATGGTGGTNNGTSVAGVGGTGISGNVTNLSGGVGGFASSAMIGGSGGNGASGGAGGVPGALGSAGGAGSPPGGGGGGGTGVCSLGGNGARGQVIVSW